MSIFEQDKDYLRSQVNTEALYNDWIGKNDSDVRTNYELNYSVYSKSLDLIKHNPFDGSNIIRTSFLFLKRRLPGFCRLNFENVSIEVTDDKLINLNISSSVGDKVYGHLYAQNINKIHNSIISVNKIYTNIRIMNNKPSLPHINSSLIYCDHLFIENYGTPINSNDEKLILDNIIGKTTYIIDPKSHRALNGFQINNSLFWSISNLESWLIYCSCPYIQLSISENLQLIFMKRPPHNLINDKLRDFRGYYGFIKYKKPSHI